MSEKVMPRKVPKVPKKSIKEALELENKQFKLSSIQQRYREHAKQWARIYEQHAKAQKNIPKIEDAEKYRDFSKPLHTQTAPRIIPRGGHPDNELLTPPEETKEEEPEAPKKRDKWETVRV